MSRISLQNTCRRADQRPELTCWRQAFLLGLGGNYVKFVLKNKSGSNDDLLNIWVGFHKKNKLATIWIYLYSHYCLGEWLISNVTNLNEFFSNVCICNKLFLISGVTKHCITAFCHIVLNTELHTERSEAIIQTINSCSDGSSIWIILKISLIHLSCCMVFFFFHSKTW